MGRYLAAPAGIYVTRVIGTKVSRGKQFFMVDGGLHHHLSAAGTFGTALRSNFIVGNLTRPDAELIRCNIAGPSCNPTDLIGVNIELPQPKIGDLIGVFNSGAYGFTSSPLYLFGRLGILFSFLGIITGAYLTVMKYFFMQPLTNRPLLFLAILLIMVGLQFVSVGLLGELIVNQSRNERKMQQVSIEKKINLS